MNAVTHRAPHPPLWVRLTAALLWIALVWMVIRGLSPAVGDAYRHLPSMPANPVTWFFQLIEVYLLLTIPLVLLVSGGAVLVSVTYIGVGGVPVRNLPTHLRAFAGGLLLLALISIKVGMLSYPAVLLALIVGGATEALAITGQHRINTMFWKANLVPGSYRTTTPNGATIKVLGPATTTGAAVEDTDTHHVFVFPYTQLAISEHARWGFDEEAAMDARQRSLARSDQTDQNSRDGLPTFDELVDLVADEVTHLLAAAPHGEVNGPDGRHERALAVWNRLGRTDSLLRPFADHPGVTEALPAANWDRWLQLVDQATASWRDRLEPPITSDDLTYTQGQVLGTVRELLDIDRAKSGRYHTL